MHSDVCDIGSKFPPQNSVLPASKELIDVSDLDTPELMRIPRKSHKYA